MKIALSNPDGISLIKRYTTSHFLIDDKIWENSLLLLPNQPPQLWDINTYTDINAAHIQQLIAEKPELLLIGTGKRMYTLHPELLSIALQQNIGVEVMDTGSACRCHNLLLEEGRRVCTGLLLLAADTNEMRRHTGSNSV